MDLTEAEDIKKRWQEYTEELCKKMSLWPRKSLWCDHSARASFLLDDGRTNSVKERKWKSLSNDPLFRTSWNSPWKYLSQNTVIGSHSLLQGIFSTQGLNPVFLHCRWIIYLLSHQGSQRILEWVAYPFSSRFSWPRNQTGVSYSAGGFFTSRHPRELLFHPFVCVGGAGALLGSCCQAGSGSSEISCRGSWRQEGLTCVNNAGRWDGG